MTRQACDEVAAVVPDEGPQAWQRRALTGDEVATIDAAITSFLRTLVVSVANNETPDDMPTVGDTARARRRMLTARHVARYHDKPTAGAIVWALYTAAILDDEGATLLPVLCCLVARNAPPTHADTLTTRRHTRRRRGPARCSHHTGPHALVSASNAPPVATRHDMTDMRRT